MRRIDKTTNMYKANLLAEQRYFGDKNSIDEGLSDKLKEYGSKIADKVKSSLSFLDSDDKSEEINSAIAQKGISDEDMLSSVKELESKGFDMSSGIKGNWNNIVKMAQQKGADSSLNEGMLTEGKMDINNIITGIGFGSASVAAGALIYANFFMGFWETAWKVVSSFSVSWADFSIMGLTLGTWVYVLVIGIIVGGVSLWYRKFKMKK